jgi:hypothetical protein
VPFMQAVFTEPDSADVIAEVTSIGLEATPDVIVAQALETNWQWPAQLLGSVSCPTLVIHGDSDEAVPVSVAQSIVDAVPNARLELIPGGGHRPDIRSPELVNPLLKAFSSTERSAAPARPERALLWASVPSPERSRSTHRASVVSTASTRPLYGRGAGSTPAGGSFFLRP